MSDQGRPVFNDRYEIHRRIGRGGMADVFLARDQLLDRPVAIKVLFPEFAADPNFVERFRREAQSAANLNHPNIVGVYDWGQQGSTYFIVMEYVEGRSLAEILRAEGRILPQRAADVATDVAAALAFAHRSGVVHRDIKPANILISPSGQVKVADFGIARAMGSGAEQGLTQAGAVMGTAAYFSPEQAQGGALDPRSDLYSLGIVLYESVTGRPPFTGENPVAIAYQQVHDRPQPPSQREADVAPALEAIILKLLAKNPANRYTTADDLRADLRRYREGRAVLAEPRLAPPSAATTMAPAAPGRSGDATTMVPVAGRPPAYPQQAYQQATTMQPAQVPPTTAVPMGGGYLPPDQREPRRVGAYLGVVLGIILIVGALIFGLLQLLGGGGNDQPETATVQNVVGKTLTEATTLLTADGFKVTSTTRPDDVAPVDVVLEQTPPAEGQLALGEAVQLVVSAGKAAVTVPGNLAGLPKATVLAQLTSLGLVPTEQQEQSDTVPVDTVIRTEPATGQVPAGGPIKVFVSVGPAPIAVPDLSGDDGNAATATLARNFKVTPVRENSNDVPSGDVIRTEPGPGTMLAKDAEVRLVISSGKAQATVPNMVGDTEDVAKQKLTGLGLVPQVVSFNLDPGDPNDGKVINQNPPQNQKVDAGSTVIITVGKARPAPTTTTTSTTTPSSSSSTPSSSSSSTPTTAGKDKGNGNGNG